MPSKEEKTLPVKILSTSDAKLRAVIRKLPDSRLESVAESLKQLQESTGVTLIKTDRIDGDVGDRELTSDPMKDPFDQVLDEVETDASHAGGAAVDSGDGPFDELIIEQQLSLGEDEFDE